MNLKVCIPLWAAALTVSFATAFTAQAQTYPQSESTVFACVQENSGNFATIAKRGNRTTTPLIVWTTNLNSDAPGGSYTPDKRCQAVSTRLTNLVAVLGQGSLKNLWLDYGSVNKEIAICVYHSTQVGCNTRNVVFTLKPENRAYADEILANLKQFSQTGAGAPIFEFAPSENNEAIPTRAVSLEKWSNQALESESDADAVPGSYSPKTSPSGNGEL